MASKTVIFAAAAAFGAALVNAQAAINWEYIPSACSSDCAQTIESAYLCETTYSDSTEVYGCFCNNFPSDASTCATCLSSNDASALSSLLTSSETACPAAITACTFECSFTTCSSSDVSCQCDATYLENIYNCGACNTANGNTGATQLSDWQSLDTSCANQNYAAASNSAAFTTMALPTINTDGYTAPTLTATGGGVAATGATSDIAAGTSSGSSDDSTAAATDSSTAAAAASTEAAAASADSTGSTDSTDSTDSTSDASSDATTSADNSASTASSAAASGTTTKAATSTTKAASSTSKASGSTTKASTSTTASSSSDSTTSSSSAGNIVAPAVGGVLGLAGLVLALI